MPVFSNQFRVNFGDCDPAGIVFYPNFFRWTEKVFHLYLAELPGGHAALCAKLNALGLGLMDVEMKFRNPVVEGNILDISIEKIDWSERAFKIAYCGRVENRASFVGQETRGLFVHRAGEIRAAKVTELREILGGIHA